MTNQHFPPPNREEIEKILKEFGVKPYPFLVDKLIALNISSYQDGKLSILKDETHAQ